MRFTPVDISAAIPVTMADAAAGVPSEDEEVGPGFVTLNKSEHAVTAGAKQKSAIARIFIADLPFKT
jgi:hypothetical protein